MDKDNDNNTRREDNGAPGAKARLIRLAFHVHAASIVVRSADCRAITASQIPDVLQEWRTPEHEAFRPRNAWSLFNAFASVYRTINPHTALRCGEALHGLFDAVVGMS